MPPTAPPFALFIDPTCPRERADALFQFLGLFVCNTTQGSPLVLRLLPDRLELQKTDDPSLPGTLWVDFTLPALKRRSLHPGRELLIQAAKVRKGASSFVIDATAGLGRDSFLLAAAGCQVQMFERNPVVAALLLDGLERAARVPGLDVIVERMHLTVGDAFDALAGISSSVDVVYLDPMFPERSKAAKVKKELQLLQLLEHAPDDAHRLLCTALQIDARKVVVKRPLNSPSLLNSNPSYALKGKTIRFDVYVGGGTHNAKTKQPGHSDKSNPAV